LRQHTGPTARVAAGARLSRRMTRATRTAAAGVVATVAVAGVVAATATGAQANGLGTALFDQSFTTNQILTSNGSISVPGAPVSSNNPTGANDACLTVTQTSTSPLPNCTPAPDASGSAALQLTEDVTTKEGGVFAATSVPASQGLDLSFDTYQYGGNGADGITFVLAAVDPADPLAPTVIGQAGGSLGYSAHGSTLPGLQDGYLGLGLDTYGNFSNDAYQGTGCPTPEPAGFGALGKGQVVVRGPGNGTQGYCGLQSTHAASPLALDMPGSTGTRTGSMIPVEVIINTTGSAFTAQTDSALSVPAGDYAIVFTPIGGSKRYLLGLLPSVAPTFYGASTSSWLDANGIPKQLAFGWVASTGGSKDTHAINTIGVSSINPVPKLDVTQTDQDLLSGAGSGTVPQGDPVTYTVTPSIDSAGTAEAGTITVTDTLPTGVTPTSAGGVGWICQPPSGQQVVCTDTAGPFAVGSALPMLYVNGRVTAGAGVAETTIESQSVVTASGAGADPGYALATPVGPRAAITDVTLTPASGTSTTSLVVTSAGHSAELARAAEVDVAGMPYGRCPTTTPSAGCFVYDAGNDQIDITSLPSRDPGSVPVIVTADGTDSTSPTTFNYVEAPQITTTSLPNAEINVPYSQALGSTGKTGALTWTSGPLPVGLTLNPSTGIISGTPTAAGTVSFPTDFTDSFSPPQQAPSDTLSITVAATPTLVTPPPLPMSYVGIPYSTGLATTGGVGPFTYAVTGGELPAGLTLDPSTGNIVGIPTTADGSGPSTFTVTATDSYGVVTTPVTYSLPVLNVVAVPQPPAAPAGAVDSTTGAGTDPSASSAAPSSGERITVTGTGTGQLRVSTLGPNPTGISTTDPVVDLPDNDFYTIGVSPASSLTSVVITISGTSDTAIYWWNGTTWQPLQGVTRNADGDLTATITASTAPGLSQLSGATFAAGGLEVDRIAGSGRTETSIATSLATFPTAGSAGAVVLARDDVFADALTGGPLAAAKNAPILLTDPDQLIEEVATELERVLPRGGTVYLLGGLVALHANVATAVTADGYHAVRIDGPDRFGTAVAIAGALGNPATIFEATGRDFPDAVSAGPAAIVEHGAILLTNGPVQSADSAAYLAHYRPTSRYAVGGSAAAADPTAIKLVGFDRYGTAVYVAQRFFPSPSRVGLATGDDFADALVAAPSLGLAGAPLLLTSSTLPPSVAVYLASQESIASATLYGGTTVLPPAIVSQVEREIP
jgi:uncharacterized repeat protein (TIGR01451 family)